VAKQYWRLALNYHAVTLALTAPANQVQLTATPVTAQGDTIAANAPVRFTSSDSAVQVDSTGLLTAHSPEAGVLIIATLTVGGTSGVTLSDTVDVNVNDVGTVPLLTRLEVHTPGDSARTALTVGITPTVQMYDASGDTIPNTKFYVNVQDTSIAKIASFTYGGHWGGALTGARVGQTRLIVDAMVYGVHKSDTLEMGVGYPIFQVNSLTQTSDTAATFSLQDLTIGTGGVVLFGNGTQTPMDIVFDDSTAPQSATPAQMKQGYGQVYCLTKYKCPVTPSDGGDIWELVPQDTLKKHVVGFTFRRFPTPGTYPFHTRPLNASGVIHVE
jgi:hypothetical protein